MTKDKCPVTAKKSHSKDSVGIAVNSRCGGYHGGWATIALSETLTVAQARQLAADLVTLADAVDAKAARDQAAEDRRKKWRDREVAAGRMVVMSASEFLGRRG